MEVTAEDFATLHEACEALDAARVPYVIGGGTVVVLYGRYRRTKDFDIFLNRNVLNRALRVLARIGFTTSDTDKKWLYKAWRGATLIDFIVESRGGVTVDAETMRRARIVRQYGFAFRVMGPEDTLYRKILTLTEGRPDWYDALSIIERQQGKIDWRYLLRRAASNPRRILAGLLFAQTELHVPSGQHRTSPDELYTGDAPGLIPHWVIHALVMQIFARDIMAPLFLPELEELPKAA